MATIFTDSGVFVAIGSERDGRHAEAVAAYDGLIAAKETLVTTNHVVDETCTWLMRRLPDGHKRAVRFGVTISSGICVLGTKDLAAGWHLPHRLVVVYSTPDIESLAWDIFARHDTAGFSFTDCVSFAVMQMLGIKKAFTFDEHYDVMGFERL